MREFSSLTSLVTDIDSLAIEDTNEKRVENLMLDLSVFHKAREKTYKRSFARRGFVGIFMNLVRKTDRLDALVESLLKTTSERHLITLIDTLVDITLYALKWLDAIKIVYPEQYKQWESSVYEPEVSALIRKESETAKTKDE